MVFINISSDVVQIIDGDQQEILERNGIENTLWKALLTYINAKHHDPVLLLNGPWWFTNLRVGTLSLNMINALLYEDTKTYAPLYSITKIALYTYAYQQHWLPRYGIIYIGQKHKVRKYDFAQQSYETIHVEEISYADDIFLDSVYHPYWADNQKMVTFHGESNQWFLQRQTHHYPLDIQSLAIDHNMTAQPEYMIQPTMN